MYKMCLSHGLSGSGYFKFPSLGFLAFEHAFFFGMLLMTIWRYKTWGRPPASARYCGLRAQKVRGTGWLRGRLAEAAPKAECQVQPLLSRSIMRRSSSRVDHRHFWLDKEALVWSILAAWRGNMLLQKRPHILLLKRTVAWSSLTVWLHGLQIRPRRGASSPGELQEFLANHKQSID